MGVTEVLSLTAVLLLALYGAAHFVTWAVWRILRPRKPQMRLTATVDEKETELQLRFAITTAERIGVPLAVRLKSPTPETVETVRRLCGDTWKAES